MCFCATGSFAASGVLAAVGLVTLSVARPDELVVAATPLIFALQQLIEGFQWMVPHPGWWSMVLGYGFLIFAFPFWPAFVSFAVFSYERNPRRKRILRWLAAIGAFISVALIWILYTQPLTITMHPNGVEYSIHSPLQLFGVMLYLLAVCGSLLVSSHRSIQWLGVASVASALGSWIVFQQTFFSTWCFFAAILSVFVFFIVKRKRPERKR